MIIEIIFWFAFAGIIYAYFGYPLFLMLLTKMNSKKIRLSTNFELKSVSIIIPVHNEEAVIKDKLVNTQALDYPKDKLEIIIVSDGSTDNTDSLIKEFNTNWDLKYLRVGTRKGKANALNTGLQQITNEIVVFSDSSIMLEKDALIAITKPFADSEVGCVSGEDHIPGNGGEGMYGKYELYLRKLESQTGSIVGASGSFYAQRRQLCAPFIEGLAPDFLSVLNTVQQGYRAISEPSAKGIMAAVSDTGAEFRRKVRTLLRGMTTLWAKRSLMNPLKNPTFAFVLISHKLMRWVVPLFLIVLLIANSYLLSSEIYKVVFFLQLLFYGLALLAWFKLGNLHNKIYGKIPLYFTIVNFAILRAWVLLFKGIKLEIWEPSKRSN
jgi:glycosyltransferase involved in cell wall biosynthesis